MLGTLIVIAKSPVPGRVKTRLCPPLSFEQAADLADAALTDTVRVAAVVPAARHVLALDGPRWPAIPSQWTVVSQEPGELDRRLIGAFAAAGAGPSLLIGMDTPQVTLPQLTMFDADRFDACIGLADDGGFWAIGFRDSRAHADAIRDVPMSTSETGQIQLAALRSRGLRVQVLDRLTDVDTYDDAVDVASQCPDGAFATRFRSLALRDVG